MDFVRHRTPQKINFARFRTPQKIGTSPHWTEILFCGVLSENTTFQDNSIKMDTTWFKVSSIVLCMCFVLLLFGAETLPTDLYKAT